MKAAHKTAITLATATAIAMAVPQVKKYEGLWTTVKPDTLAHGLPTGGYGETENVKLGETHTEAYWAARLARRLPEYDAKIAPCIRVALPDGVRATLISEAYNAGPAAVCHGTPLAKMNAGDIRGGCAAIKDWYVRSGGQVRQGLINRRNDESAKCLAGMKASPASPASPAKTCPEPAPVAVKHWWSWIFK
jgi:lysozyme